MTSNPERTYCFVDTNILLHFQTYDEVDWPTVLGVREVVLVLAPIVLSELDKHKHDSSNNWRMGRARTLISKLDGHLESAEPSQPALIRKGAYLMDVTTEPNVEWAELELDPAIPDDRLLATILMFESQHSDKNVCLITGDIGAKRKARARRIRTVSPDGINPVDRSSEPDATSKRQQRNIRENPLPEIVLLFKDSNGRAGNTIRSHTPINSHIQSEASITQHVQQKRQFFEKTVAEARGKVPIDQFNNFLVNYSLYLKRLEYTLYLQRTTAHNMILSVVLVLENRGSAPAIDLELMLHFPEYSFVVGFNDIKDEDWGAVNEPDEPIAEWSRNRGVYNTSKFDYKDLSDVVSLPSVPRLDFMKPPIRKGPLYDEFERNKVWFEDPKLRHKSEWELEPLAVYLPPGIRGGFSIDYDIHADNLTDRIERKLHVKFSD